MIARSFKYRLYPNAAQARRLEAWQAACWEIQRLCIRQRRIAWKRRIVIGRGALPSFAGQCREITELRAEYSYLSDVPADTMSAIARRIDEAYQKMRKATGKRPIVRWANEAADIGLVFRGANRGTSVQPINSKYALVTLASAGKLGMLRMRNHRLFPAGAEIKQTHITRSADGWYITFSCLIPDVDHLPPTVKDMNGVDLNVKHKGDKQQIAAVDDGRVYCSTSGLKKNAQRLATLQKLVSHKRRTRGTAKAADPHSARTAKRRARIARLHQRITRQREHTLQYVARRLVDTANAVAFEALNLRGMRKRGKGRSKRGLNRALSTAAPGRLIELTKEKAEVAGRAVVMVDPRNTTQACNACGVIGERKGLEVRSWTCAACGARHDRDINAARNIRARGLDQDTSTFRAGVPGERRAVSDRECGPMNLEGATAPAREQRGGTQQSRSVRKSRVLSNNHQVAKQLSLFDDV